MGGIAIHGFGRIGRSTLRGALQNDYFSPIAISDVKDLPTLAALLAVDTNYGRWHEEVSTGENALIVRGREIPYYDVSRWLPD